MSALLKLTSQFSRSAMGKPDVGFRMTVEGAKRLFFDRESVLAAADKAELRALSRFGYFTMRDARQSIRNPPKKRRGTASDAGSPPYNQSGLLKRFIFFSYSPQRHSVVVGPTLLEGHIRFLQIPRVLEEGGMSRLTRPRPRTGDRRDRQRANIYGKTVRIRPRPYMKPAFDRQVDKQLPGLWRDAISR